MTKPVIPRLMKKRIKRKSRPFMTERTALKLF